MSSVLNTSPARKFTARVTTDSDDTPMTKSDTPARSGVPTGKREHYIPVLKSELTEHIRSSLPEGSRPDFSAFCQLVSKRLHADYHTKFDELTNAYALVDPDRDTKQLTSISAEKLSESSIVVFDEMAALMKRANFHRLSQSELEEAIGAASEWGVKLQVDLEVFDRLEVYGRGDVISRRVRRTWHNFYRPEEIDVPIYQRLVAVFRIDEEAAVEEVDSSEVHLKMFKNIPKDDLDMMLPGSKVRMTWLDQGRILFPTISGIGLTIFKLITKAIVLAFTGIYGLIAFCALVIGMIGYGVKSFFGYIRTKDKYHLNLTRSLYYQNLDNNRGVLHRLMNEAEEQDYREMILAYVTLWQNAGEQGWNAETIDNQIETELEALLDMDIDFEVRDALQKLQKFGMAEYLSSGCWRATEISTLVAPTVTTDEMPSPEQAPVT